MQEHPSEEVAECRICRCEGDDERPLFYPCACTGSIKWCHESCLVEWIKVSRTREHCETCGTALVFKPVYSESTPAILPASELTWLGLKRLAKEVPYLARATIVTIVWLVFVPVWSASVFNYMRPSLNDNDEPSSSWIEWFATRPSPISFSTWETGVWILLAGFFSLFMLVSVFDFVRGFESGEYAVELEAFRLRGQQNHQANNADALNAAPAVQNNPHDADADGADAANGGDDLDALEDEVDAGENGDEGFDGANNNDNNNNVNNLGGNNRNEAIEDLAGDQLGFDEWVGLRGPWCLIMNNVMCLCFCILLFLVTFYVVPESLGRGVYREAYRLSAPVESAIIMFPEASSSILAFMDDFPMIEPYFANYYQQDYKLETKTETCPVTDTWSLQWFKPSRTAMTATCEPDQIMKSARRLERYKFEAFSVALGLTVTMLFIQLQFQACSLSWKLCVSRALRPTFPFRGVPYHVWKSVLRSTRTVIRVQKVVCLLIFKMIAFPIVLGLLIDHALRPAIALSDPDRLMFMSEHPHLTALVLWVAGITHTLLVTMNVILVRDILHHEVLDGIIRMRDPHGNQFLPLLVEPLLQQTKRTLITCMIYTAIVLLFVSIPCYFAEHYLHILPLPVSMRFVAVGFQMPVELTLFHMWMLHVLEKSKSFMVKAQKIFFESSCRWLGLTEFLLPVPNNANEYADALQRAQIQAGQLHWLDSAPRVSNALLRARERPRFVVLRVLALLAAAWATWLTTVVICLALPYFVGLGAVSCLPSIPAWIRTDVRLYFIGWVILRSLKTYASKAIMHSYRLFNYASRDVRDSVPFVAAAAVLSTLFPLLCGMLVFLETAFSDSDFPAERFSLAHHTTAASMFATFLMDFVQKLPIMRAWLAGFPFVLMVSTKTHPGRVFWRCVFDWRLAKAGKIATKVIGIGMLSSLVGVYVGLEFWGRAGLTSSPLSTIRASVLIHLLSTMIPIYLRKYYNMGKAACRRFHDTLKDEKYLMGRRLRNYDSRV